MFASFLRSRVKAIAFFAFLALLLAAWFFFNSLDARALIYPLMVEAVVGLIILIADWYRTKAKHEQISVIDDFVATADRLPPPESVTEEDLIRLISDLCDEHAATVSSYDTGISDTRDYYTMWVHQIKTPISAMRLKLESMDGEDVASLKLQLMRIEQYVEMALVYQRLDSTQTDYVFRTADLKDIVSESVRKFSTEFIRRHIALEYEVTSQTILTDEKWLGFVIDQIISNALKYTNEGHIKIYNEGTDLFIEDTGIGIRAEDLPRLFEKGYTGDNGRMDKRASGIGLYLCKRITENLGNGISITSEVGRGTTVRLSLERRETVVE